MDWRDWLTNPIAWICAVPALLGMLFLTEVVVILAVADRHMGTVVGSGSEQIYLGLPSTWRWGGTRRAGYIDPNGTLIVQVPTVDQPRRRLELETGIRLLEPDLHATVSILTTPAIPGRAYLAWPANLFGPAMLLFLFSGGLFYGLYHATKTRPQAEPPTHDPDKPPDFPNKGDAEIAAATVAATAIAAAVEIIQ